MSSTQLFLLILTIWSVGLFTQIPFETVLPPEIEFRTYYLEKAPGQGRFLGRSLEDFGRRGWKIAAVQQDPDNRDQLIIFLQRRRVMNLD